MIKKTLLIILALISNVLSFAQQYGSFKDARDGKVYKTVKIGEQIWMAKNLNVEKFRNGDPILEAKTNDEWKTAAENKQPAWCYYENDPANGAKYGKLYNWYAVSDSRGIAPVGYHIPSYAEWTKLTDYLGSDAGTKMKSKSGWNSYTTGGSKTCPNCVNWNAEYRRKVPCHTCKDTRSVDAPIVTKSGNGTNTSGFSGLPGAYRHNDGTFNEIGSNGYWWRSTEGSIPYFRLDNKYSWPGRIGRGSLTDNWKSRGFSVRCLRD
jgi:uncharacterized protein (TIGR02145 family)